MTTRLDIRVIPRSPRNVVDGIRDGRVIVRVTSPPVEGAANDAVISTLAAALDLPRRSVRIVSGATGRNKTVEISDLDAAAVRARLVD